MAKLTLLLLVAVTMALTTTIVPAQMTPSSPSLCEYDSPQMKGVWDRLCSMCGTFYDSEAREVACKANCHKNLVFRNCFTELARNHQEKQRKKPSLQSIVANVMNF